MESAKQKVADTGQLVVFVMDGQEFALDISQVMEIVRPQHSTRVPMTPDYFLGLMNLRGNIIPVIDTRKRLGIPERPLGDEARCLVVSHRDYLAGMIVDEVREVRSCGREVLEPPPQLAESLEQFVDKVAKLDDGQRIIFLLEPGAVIESGVEFAVQDRREKGIMAGAGGESGNEPEVSSEFRKFITFRLSQEVYALDICDVHEIIRYMPLTGLPDAGTHIKGMLTIRGRVMPVFDLRTLMGLDSMISERGTELDRLIRFVKGRTDEAGACIKEGREFKRCPSGTCILDNWLHSRLEECRSERELNIIQAIIKEHQDLHDKVMDGGRYTKDQQASRISSLQDRILGLLEQYRNELDLCVKEENRILILSAKNRLYGLLVDRVEEVISVPAEAVDKPDGFSDDLKAIVRLEGGTKVVFVLDHGKVVPADDIEEYGDEETEDMPGDIMESMEADELQLVTFNIGNEEYGIPITDVQEINRLSGITRVPKAPEFVEGVTNLRGEVIPVIDLRRRFGIEPGTRDDRTRLIITNIAGIKTALVVDRVNEVKRFARSSIEPPPAILASQVALDFVSGIAKAGEDGRMIIVLEVERILSGKEIDALGGVEGQGRSPSVETDAGHEGADLEIME